MARIKRGLLRAEYKIKGEKLRYLPEFLHRKKISVYNFRLINDSECYVTIDFQDIRKFFAICKNMCYNKLIVRYKGLLSPFVAVFKRIGLFVGAVLFTLVVIVFNNLVLDVKVVGSGSCFKEQTKGVVYDFGVKKYTAFSSIDYKALETEILSNNPRLSFVTVKKQGNILVIDTVLSDKEPSVLGKNTDDLISNYNGVVEEITVLRGTALVRVGETVKKGDKLVGAYLIGKDQAEYQTFVLARVKILEKTEYFYKCDENTEQNLSIAYALAEFNINGEIKEKTHSFEEGGIRVTVTVRRTVYGG